MTDVSPRKAIFAQLAELAKALGNPHRLELLQFISQGERTVERLSNLTGMTVANTSQHLQMLRRAGLAKTRRDGKNILYSLTSPSVLGLINMLSEVAEQSSAEVRMLMMDYFHQLDKLEPVSREDLLGRIKDDGVTILDVRPDDEYALGHLPGAWSIPSVEIEERIKQLPKDQTIVAYCRGTYCISSFQMVAKLRELGYDVHRMEQGFPEWVAAGLEFETGSEAENSA